MERLATERLTAERLTMERLATETLATESVGAAACVAMLASPLSTIKRVLSTRFPHWGNEPRPTHQIRFTRLSPHWYGTLVQSRGGTK